MPSGPRLNAVSRILRGLLVLATLAAVSLGVILAAILGTGGSADDGTCFSGGGLANAQLVIGFLSFGAAVGSAFAAQTATRRRLTLLCVGLLVVWIIALAILTTYDWAASAC